MIYEIKQSFRMRNALKQKKLFNKGFDYAAGCLLRSEKTPFELEAEEVTDYHNSFDEGMDCAIRLLCVYRVCNDDRI